MKRHSSTASACLAILASGALVQLLGCSVSGCRVSAVELGARQLECRERVRVECPSYRPGRWVDGKWVDGECSTERGAPCPQCPAVEQCNRWIEEQCR